MITFFCNACGKNLKVKDEQAGRKGKCPKCGTALRVPDLSTVPHNTDHYRSSLQTGRRQLGSWEVTESRGQLVIKKTFPERIARHFLVKWLNPTVLFDRNQNVVCVPPHKRMQSLDSISQITTVLRRTTRKVSVLNDTLTEKDAYLVIRIALDRRGFLVLRRGISFDFKLDDTHDMRTMTDVIVRFVFGESNYEQEVHLILDEARRQGTEYMESFFKSGGTVPIATYYRRN